MAIIVPIVSSWNPEGLDKAIAEIKRAEGTFEKISRTANIASASFIDTGKNLTKYVTGGLIAAGGALVLMTKQAAEAEAQQHRLRQILLTTGGATNKQVDALLDQAKALEKVGVASKQSIITTQAQLATFDLQADTITRLTPAILDYVLAEKGARATSEDFKTMTNGLALALDGQFGALTRVGFILDDHTKKMISSGTEAERADAIVKVLNSTYKDFNKALAETPEGRMILLQREFTDLKDEIGKALLPTMDVLMKFIKDQIIPIFRNATNTVTAVIDYFNKLNEATQRQIISLAIFIAAMGPTITVIGYVMKAVDFLTLSFARLQKSVLKIPLAIFFVGAAIIKLTGMAETWSEAFYKAGRIVLISFYSVGEQIANTINLLIKGINVYKKFKGEAQLNEVSYAGFIKGYDNLYGTVTDFAAGLRQQQAELKSYADQATAMANSIGDTTRSDSVAGGAKKADDAIGAFQKRLNDAKNTLQAAKDKFVEFAQTIAGSIRSVINFGNAASDESGTFIENLVKQANNAKLFADKVRQLIALGLNEEALREVLNAGAEAGGKIADEIIAGGASVVDQVNKILEATQSLANEVGLVGADQFYKAGVQQGEALVKGVIDAIRAAGLSIDSEGNVSGVSVPGGAGAGGAVSVPSAPSAPATGGAPSRSGTQTKVPANVQGVLNKLRTIPMMAEGGIVKSPTLAMIGEAGPEAVVPLNRMGRTGSTYNITVNAGMGANGQLIGKEIVDAIKRYERTSGPVFASA